MGSCSYCGSTIWFRGVRDAELRFCNADCQQRGHYIRFVDQLPQDLVRDHVRAVHQGNCPACGKTGPIDVHRSFKIWSALVLTSWKTEPRISCRKCATAAQSKGIVYSLFLGWWGFPWGFIITPIQIIKNIHGMVAGPDAAQPTPDLERLVKLNLAEQIISNRNAQA